MESPPADIAASGVELDDTDDSIDFSESSEFPDSIHEWMDDDDDDVDVDVTDDSLLTAE
jgi:hypothetical protein